MTSRGPYRRHSTPFKLQLCQDIRAGALGRRDAQRSHNLSANLIQLWLTQYDRGELNDEEVQDHRRMYSITESVAEILVGFFQPRRERPRRDCAAHKTHTLPHQIA